MIRFLSGTPHEEANLIPAVRRASSAAASVLPLGLRKRAVRRVGLHWYGRERLLQELTVARPLMFSRGTVVHHLYAEESYRFGGYLPRLRGNALIGTFHQPPSRFRDFVPRAAHLRRLDAVIAVARNQAEFLRTLVEERRVFFVPHGVDVDFFTPAPEPPREFRCLFVGYWMRDFAVLRELIALLVPRGVRFDLVLTPGKARIFSGAEGVDVHSGIGEDDLLAVYRRASMLVLPLLDGTSNNALLEAMACGLPVVTTDVGGVRDYCDASHCVLVPPGEVEGFCEAIVRLAGAEGLRRKMGIEARRQAVARFDWKVVTAEIVDVYRQILG